MVSIVVVNWNGRDLTLACLRSLERVTYQNRTTIVVDNASSDGSAAAIRSEFPRVTLLEMPENLRFAGGNNAGIRHALAHGSDAVLLLNNDTTVDSAFLTHLVERLSADPTVGATAPKIFYATRPDLLWSAGGVISLWTGTMRHLGIRQPDADRWDHPRTLDYASGCCLLVRRSVIEQVGYLDEAYYMYTEDADWCMRMRLGGYSIMFEPKARIWHAISVSSGGHLSWYKMRNKFISNLRFFGKYAAWYQWLVFPWMNLLVNAVAAVRYLFEMREK